MVFCGAVGAGEGAAAGCGRGNTDRAVVGRSGSRGACFGALLGSRRTFCRFPPSNAPRAEYCTERRGPAGPRGAWVVRWVPSEAPATLTVLVSRPEAARGRPVSGRSSGSRRTFCRFPPSNVPRAEYCTESPGSSRLTGQSDRPHLARTRRIFGPDPAVNAPRAVNRAEKGVFHPGTGCRPPPYAHPVPPPSPPNAVLGSPPPDVRSPSSGSRRRPRGTTPHPRTACGTRDQSRRCHRGPEPWGPAHFGSAVCSAWPASRSDSPVTSPVGGLQAKTPQGGPTAAAPGQAIPRRNR